MSAAAFRNNLPGPLSVAALTSWLRLNYSHSRLGRRREATDVDDILARAWKGFGARPRLEDLLTALESIGASVFTDSASGNTFARVRRLVNGGGT